MKPKSRRQSRRKKLERVVRVFVALMVEEDEIEVLNPHAKRLTPIPLDRWNEIPMFLLTYLGLSWQLKRQQVGNIRYLLGNIANWFGQLWEARDSLFRTPRSSVPQLVQQPKRRKRGVRHFLSGQLDRVVAGIKGNKLMMIAIFFRAFSWALVGV